VTGSHFSDLIAGSKRHGIPLAGKIKGLNTTVCWRPELWQGLCRS